MNFDKVSNALKIATEEAKRLEFDQISAELKNLEASGEPNLLAKVDDNITRLAVAISIQRDEHITNAYYKGIEEFNKQVSKGISALIDSVTSAIKIEG